MWDTRLTTLHGFGAARTGQKLYCQPQDIPSKCPQKTPQVSPALSWKYPIFERFWLHTFLKKKSNFACPSYACRLGIPHVGRFLDVSSPLRSAFVEENEPRAPSRPKGTLLNCCCWRKPASLQFATWGWQIEPFKNNLKPRIVRYSGTPRWISSEGTGHLLGNAGDIRTLAAEL